MVAKKDTIPNELKILCPFCNSPYTAKMETELESTEKGCDSCGYGESAIVSIEVYCENCKRLVYKKEGHKIY